MTIVAKLKPQLSLAIFPLLLHPPTPTRKVFKTQFKPKLKTQMAELGLSASLG